MLSNINIKNFTIIDQLNLDFASGMTVLTGETGAGKSVIVDAVTLALGARVNGEVVQHGNERADISISFDINDNVVVQNCLKELALDDSNTCIMRRIISKDGRSKSFVNDVPITQQSLRKIAENLISIHGQHEFQSLLKRDAQQKLLDEFAGNQQLLQKIAQLYHLWQQKKTAYESLLQSAKDATAREEFLVYQLKELDELELVENETLHLQQEHQQLAHADTLLHNCQLALAATMDNEESNAVRLLHQAIRAVETIIAVDPKLANVGQLLNSAVLDAEEAAAELRHYLAAIDLNPQRLHYVEQRIAKLHDIARKHHVQVEELLVLRQQMQTELDKLQHKDEHLQILAREIKAIADEYFIIAQQLSQKRTQFAHKLEQQVMENMQQLGMSGGKFAIQVEKLTDKQPKIFGQEKIRFMVTANAGQPLQPLAKVASGGELSRISLAVQVITAQKNQTPVLIFDEVDVGIGGAIAEIVGKLLRKLGTATQTLCITHLAQVAAKGHNHLYVEKQHQRDKTQVNISYLDKQGKVRELARMLGGIEITPQTIAHAEEMLLDSYKNHE